MDEQINQTPQTPSVPPVELNQTPKKFNKWLGITLGILVLAIIAAGAFYLKNKSVPNNSQNNNSNPSQAVNPVVNNSTPSLQQAGKAPAIQGVVSGQITWHYPTDPKLNFIKTDDPNYQYDKDVPIYDAGTFNQGPYQGRHLVIAQFPCDGPCSVTAKLAVNTTDLNSKYIFLANYSDGFDNINPAAVDTSRFTIDKTTKISDLDLPQTIKGPVAKQSLSLAQGGNFQASYNLFTSDKLKLVFNDPTLGSVYTTPDDSKSVDSFFGTYGFYVKAPDWSTAVYKMTPDFVGTDNIPNVIWNDNTQNHQDYNFVNVGGCGSTDYGAVISPTVVKISDLSVAGKTSNGDAIYEFKDSNAQMLKDMYNQEYNPYNSSYQADASLKIPYEQFVASHPMFFWTDPFGRLIQLKNKKFIVSAAECGKPVIYLYPQKTENVSVKLSPTSGFSYTEPDYANGWNVVANSSGELTNLADNKIYPYLFWEGRSSDLYQIPDKGFVVAKNDVHEFLNSKLKQLGLNQKETVDFEAYWEPYMQSSPYYFVTFMGNQVMDQIAPLQVTPKPDTIIRVLMDFKPLDKPINVQGYDIKTPVRKGFTVIEWGGVKH